MYRVGAATAVPSTREVLVDLSIGLRLAVVKPGCRKPLPGPINHKPWEDKTQ